MNIFKILKNFIVCKEESNKFINENITLNIENNDIVEFSSDTVVPISVDGYINTNDKYSLAKYTSNLRLLANKAYSDGEVSSFKIIRNDDFFPIDYKWSVNSKNTGIELNGSAFTYELRHAYAEKLADVSYNDPFGIKLPASKVEEIFSNLDKHIGRFYAPVMFRSTKHFTINTPLGYTHDYNFVSANRMFTIIDDIDNFVNSGYTYSLAPQDAYLDISHEPLAISQNAIVMISKDNYEKIKNNSIIIEQLSKMENRRLIIFDGDESSAINMILSENGVLPSKIEHKSLNYDSSLTSIVEKSMINLANRYNIDYNLSHGFFNGKGHFSDYYDCLNPDNQFIGTDLVKFFKSELPDVDIDERFVIDSDVASRFISEVGVDRLLSLVDKYNIYMQQEINRRYYNYKDDRNSITPEISNLFKTTLKFIKEYYKNESLGNDKLLEEQIRLFFQSDSVEEQRVAASNICKSLRSGLSNESDNYNVSFTK